MINENNSKTEALEVLSLIKLEIDLLKERLDDLVCNFSESEFHHLEDNYNVGFSPFGPSPHSQGGSLQKELNLNDEVLFRDNDRRNVHGFISDIAEDWIEVSELDIFDNPTHRYFRFKKEDLPGFLKRVSSYGI